jgi:hypothetical protein
MDQIKLANRRCHYGNWSSAGPAFFGARGWQVLREVVRSLDLACGRE